MNALIFDLIVWAILWLLIGDELTIHQIFRHQKLRYMVCLFNFPIKL